MRTRLATVVAAMAGSVAAQPTAEPIELDGLIEPKTRVIVSAAIEGVVETVLVDRGDVVEAGQILATLEASVEKKALEVARLRAIAVAPFDRNEARLNFAERTLERSAALEEDGILALRDRDEAEAEKALAEAGLSEAREARKMAEADLVRAQAVVELRTIRSPIDGVVVERLLSPGDLADPAQLIELAQIDPLHVEVFAPLSVWGRIQEGMVAEVSPEAPVGGVHEAKVVVVDRVLDAASGTFRVRLELPNPDHALPAGLKCRVRFADEATLARDDPAESLSTDPIQATDLTEPTALTEPEPELPTTKDTASTPAVAVSPLAAVDIALEEAQPSEPQESVEATATLKVAPARAAKRKGSVRRARFTTEVVRREPGDAIERLTNDHSQILYFTEFRDMEGQTATHQWEFNGRVVSETSFEIGGPRWRVYSFKELLPTQLGAWTVSVVNASGRVFRTETFEFVAADIPVPDVLLTRPIILNVVPDLEAWELQDFDPWELDEDGAFGEPDVSVALDDASIFDAAELGGAGAVTDVAAKGVPNFAPIASIRSIGGGVEGIALIGEPVALAGSFDDVAADTHTAIVDWDDGFAGSAVVDDATDTLTASHTYSTSGSRFIELLVTDSDGDHGVAVERVTVYETAGAVGAVIERIDDLLAAVTDADAETALLSARKLLDGNLGGRADDGAIDSLESGHVVTALRMIERGIAALEEFEAAAGSDLSPERQLLALVAGTLGESLGWEAKDARGPSPRF